MILSDAIRDMPAGGYRVIAADVPWRFKARTAKGLDGRPQHYERMSIKDIRSMPVADLSASDCHLFFWTSGPYLEKAFGIIRSWGFEYSSIAFTWAKLWPRQADALLFDEKSFAMGQGYTTRKNTEICLLARRGKPARKRKDVHELIISGRRQHSRKPEEFYRRVEAYADGPYIDLFARQKRPGWTVWGNQTNKFEGAA